LSRLLRRIPARQRLGADIRLVYAEAAFAGDRSRAVALPSWYGDSVGHYEGDTLVIDTIALKTDRKYAMIDLNATYGHRKGTEDRPGVGLSGTRVGRSLSRSRLHTRRRAR
jgi:hypothetical protein